MSPHRIVAPEALLDAAPRWSERNRRADAVCVTLTKHILHANVDAGSLSQAIELENRGQTLAARGADFAETWTFSGAAGDARSPPAASACDSAHAPPGTL